MLIHTFASEDACAEALADDLASALRLSLEQKSCASLALSGGRSPQKVLPRLAATPLDWGAVTVTLTDERCVAPTHADSNAAMVRACFLEKGAAAAPFYPLWDGNREAVTELENITLPIDVMYLGMGEDGHVASLFPCHDAGRFDAADSLVVSGLAPKPPHERISLGLKTILQTRHLFLHLTGAAKHRVFEDAETIAPTPECPVSLLLHAPDIDLRVYIAI